MTSWPAEPPDPEQITPLRIIRTPAKGVFKSRIISPEIQGALTHYDGRRTIRCPGKDCPICGKHIMPRWYGYLALWCTRSNATALYEFPAGPFGTFREYIQKYSTLRGAILTAWRKPHRDNGPVFVELEPPGDPSADYPEPPIVMKVLCRMWGINYEAEQASIHKEKLEMIQQNTDPAPEDHISRDLGNNHDVLLMSTEKHKVKPKRKRKFQPDEPS